MPANPPAHAAGTFGVGAERRSTTSARAEFDRKLHEWGDGSPVSVLGVRVETQRPHGSMWGRLGWLERRWNVRLNKLPGDFQDGDFRECTAGYFRRGGDILKILDGLKGLTRGTTCPLVRLPWCIRSRSSPTSPAPAVHPSVEIGVELSQEDV